MHTSKVILLKGNGVFGQMAPILCAAVILALLGAATAQRWSDADKPSLADVHRMRQYLGNSRTWLNYEEPLARIFGRRLCKSNVK